MINEERTLSNIYQSFIVEGRKPRVLDKPVKDMRIDENSLRKVIKRCSDFLFDDIKLISEGVYGDAQKFTFDSGMSYLHSDAIFVKIVAFKKLPFMEGFMKVYTGKHPILENGVVPFDRVEITYKVPGSTEVENLIFSR